MDVVVQVNRRVALRIQIGYVSNSQVEIRRATEPDYPVNISACRGNRLKQIAEAPLQQRVFQLRPRHRRQNTIVQFIVKGSNRPL